MEPLLSVVFFVTDTGKERVREFLNESVALHLSRHQHRPVITVPVAA